MGFVKTSFNYLSVFLDSAAAWFFCCVIAVIILPIVLDRIIFYIPKLFILSRNNEVYYRSVVLTFLEVVLWVTIIAAIYIVLYLYQPHLFALVTTDYPALVAWIICIANIVVRLKNFDRIIKRNFYYEIYMRYIKPEALSEYTKFIEELDSLDIDEIVKLTDEPMRYMHKQAVLRKLREITMN
jgi:hypothetical protein